LQASWNNWLTHLNGTTLCGENVSNVDSNADNELLRFVFDDLIHYSGEFNARNIFLQRVPPNRDRLDGYREEFRAIAAALRDGTPLEKVREKQGF